MSQEVLLRGLPDERRLWRPKLVEILGPSLLVTVRLSPITTSVSANSVVAETLCKGNEQRHVAFMSVTLVAATSVWNLLRFTLCPHGLGSELCCASPCVRTGG